MERSLSACACHGSRRTHNSEIVLRRLRSAALAKKFSDRYANLVRSVPRRSVDGDPGRHPRSVQEYELALVGEHPQHLFYTFDAIHHYVSLGDDLRRPFVALYSDSQHLF